MIIINNTNKTKNNHTLHQLNINEKRIWTMKTFSSRLFFIESTDLKTNILNSIRSISISHQQKLPVGIYNDKRPENYI